MGEFVKEARTRGLRRGGEVREKFTDSGPPEARAWALPSGSHSAGAEKVGFSQGTQPEILLLLRTALSYLVVSKAYDKTIGTYIQISKRLNPTMKLLF